MGNCFGGCFEKKVAYGDVGVALPPRYIGSRIYMEAKQAGLESSSIDELTIFN